MKRRRSTVRFPDPFLGWGTLAFKAAEMMAASAQVIHHRTSRQNDAAQWLEMGAEKMQAAVASSSAMALQLTRMGTHSTPAQWAAFWTSAMAPYHSKALANARKIR